MMLNTVTRSPPSWAAMLPQTFSAATTLGRPPDRALPTLAQLARGTTSAKIAKAIARRAADDMPPRPFRDRSAKWLADDNGSGSHRQLVPPGSERCERAPGPWVGGASLDGDDPLPAKDVRTSSGDHVRAPGAGSRAVRVRRGDVEHVRVGSVVTAIGRDDGAVLSVAAHQAVLVEHGVQDDADRWVRAEGLVRRTKEAAVGEIAFRRTLAC